MKKRRIAKATVLLLVSCLLIGCAGGQNGAADKSETKEKGTSQKKVAVEEPQDINAVHLRDKELLYEQDDTEVVTMYLTVSSGNTSENTNHTWEEINTYSVYDYEKMGVERYQVNGLLQVGDENGPLSGEVGYGENAPNATV